MVSGGVSAQEGKNGRRGSSFKVMSMRSAQNSHKNTENYRKIIVLAQKLLKKWPMTSGKKI